MNSVLKKLKGGLIASCQALESEPLHSSFIMSRMAYAAMEGGAAGIRANSYEDIVEIKKTVDLPVLGIVKKDYDDSPIYITPTMKEIDTLVSSGTDIIALDATERLRPQGVTLDEFVGSIRKKHGDVLLMADVSTFEEGVKAEKLGFDIVSTTLSGYTPYSPKKETPDFELIDRLVKTVKIPVIAEGKMWVREEAVQALKLGAFAVVVGTAISRPREITRRFVNAIKAAEL
jgi:N-acylglucosamine-6-phosphate 2-epimerase